jgi:hypothetical protein
VSVAVARETEHRTAAPFGRTLVSSQTWLAQPCTLLASLCAASGKRRQLAPKLDQIAIAVVPVVKDREIVDDFVDVSHRTGVPRRPLYRVRSDRGRRGRCVTARGDGLRPIDPRL